MPDTFIVTVDPDGRLHFLWDDRLAPLAALGTAQVRRASHVEPAEGGGWMADLSPSGGPVLGPFPLRGEALNAERAWIEARL